MFALGGLNKIVDLQCFPKRPDFTVFFYYYYYFISIGFLEKVLIGIRAVTPCVKDKQGGYWDNSRPSNQSWFTKLKATYNGVFGVGLKCCLYIDRKIPQLTFC